MVQATMVLFLCTSAIVAILSLLILLTALTNILVRVPSVPSSMHVVRSMLDLAQIRGHETVYDLGCGDARLLIEAKRRSPTIRAIGYELALGAYLIAKLRVWRSGLKIELHLRDFFGVTLADADVLLVYLIPEICTKLKKKLDTELRPGTRVISNGFALTGKEPTTMMRCNPPSAFESRKGARVYLYEW